VDYSFKKHKQVQKCLFLSLRASEEGRAGPSGTGEVEEADGRRGIGGPRAAV